jgi:alanyl-tRNA synthetase
MTADEIRRKFLRFFEERGHRVVASSPVVPQNDPTLLFTNAGMNQFKDVFLGRESREYTRAASSQKCIRAGGKHNDLEQVGHTARHQTFFEMLGNFSFGDYFKDQAIAWAWDLLTNADYGFALDPRDLWITIYKDDDEAHRIWKRVTGFGDERIIRLGEKDNFWQMGDTGPCGPCTEIHFDRKSHGYTPCSEHCGIGKCDCDRFLEIWNNVFMQFDRQPDGQLVPLPKPSVDTGMGLERIASVIQRAPTNYDTDLFQPIIRRIGELFPANPHDERARTAARVIADHVRALSFAFADGALPSNEGRGYVLRRILRRGARYGRNLGAHEPFLWKLVATVVAVMGAQYPELREREDHIARLIRAEEDAFNKTLDRGLERFDRAVHEVIDREHSDMFPGDVAFELYATYGFPPDLTRVLAQEKRLGFDESGFEQKLAEHVAASQGERKRGIDLREHGELPETQFLGYAATESPAEVASFVESKGELVLEKTPFYAESGGQIGDTGLIEAEDGSFLFRVKDTKKAGGVIVHYGALEAGAAAAVRPRARVRAVVDRERRLRIMKNHTATHLLHWALHRVVGEHAKQAGSVVEPDRLRFDFSHPQGLTDEEVERIERLVNEKVIANDEVSKYERSLDEARRAGVTALFGEKYGDRVRVVDIAGFSRELCGGTHVGRTGDIGPFKVVREAAVQAGVRRIEAITGPAAVDWMLEESRRLRELSRGLAVPEEKVGERVRQLQEQLKELKQKAKQAPKAAPAAESGLLEEKIGGFRFVTAVLEGAAQDELRARWDGLKGAGSVAAALVGVTDAKVAFIAAATQDVPWAAFEHAVKIAATKAGGRAGGRAGMLQGGLQNKGVVDEFLRTVAEGFRALAAAKA